MQIKEITYQDRRKIKVIYECEYCGYINKKDYYDNLYFHKNVIRMECPQCGKKADKNYRPLAIKYPDDMLA